MLASLTRRSFDRLGTRYFGAVLVVQWAFTFMVVLGGVGMLTLYEEMSGGDFLRIALVAEAVVAVENLVATRIAADILRPVRRWLDGRRDERSTVVAWRALAELPVGFLRRWKWVPPLLTIPPVTVYTTIELGLPAFSALVILAGAFVVLSYGGTLRFFTMELAMRPVLEDVARTLPEEFDLGRGGVPLRLKLLATLPMINVITGVLVAGFSTGPSEGLASLGVDVLLAVAVASTVSLELTLLLSQTILAPVGDLREATERLGRGELSARVPVVSTDEMGRLAQSFNRMAAGLEERERLREAFGTFVDPGVADRVMRDGTLHGEDLEVSILFLDIRDFTAYAERSSAREVVAFLNGFYERIVPVLHRHGGHANRFIGDGLLAVFGAPERLADHADRALAAALEIAALVRDCYGDELRIGVGVNSGPVLAGTVGGGGRLDFTVIGDAVNTAARVEEVTRQTGDDVLVTEATRALLSREPAELVRRPAVALRGKAEQVRLYAPAVERPEAPPARAAATQVVSGPVES
jgi:adenylate cyclase